MKKRMYVGVGFGKADGGDAGKYPQGQEGKTSDENQWMAPRTKEQNALLDFKPQTSVSNAGSHGATAEGLGDLARARARAMAVIEGFTKNHKEDSDRTYTDGFFNAGITSDCRRKRLECLASLERRNRLATLKNLDYVARREEENLQKKLAEIRQADLYQQELALQQQKRKSRLQKQLSTQAGIGTEERKRAERMRQRVENKSEDSIAVYISGLPLGADSSTASLEALLHSLFSCYGTIKKVHVYVNKQSGSPKGDALVIYQIGENEDEKKKLLSTVCSQMNGAELPCGSILSVEPSDPTYKLQKLAKYGERDISSTAISPALSEHKARAPSPRASSGQEVQSPSLPATNEDEDTVEDLDDFFSSLE